MKKIIVASTASPYKFAADVYTSLGMEAPSDPLLSQELLAKHTGKPLKTIEKDVERDHFLTAEQALEYGLIDEIIAPRR